MTFNRKKCWILGSYGLGVELLDRRVRACVFSKKFFLFKVLFVLP